MNEPPLHWTELANPLPSELYRDLGKSHLSIRYGPKRVPLIERKTFLWLYLEVKVLTTFQYHLNPVQHLINRAAENTDVVEIKQEREILLISKTHLHEVTKTCSHIRQSKWHVSKLV